MKRSERGKRIMVWLLTVALTLGMLTGCGSAEVTDETGPEEASGSNRESQEEEQGTAMGRYVEKDVELNGNALTDWNSRVFRMADGSLLLADNSGFVLRSQDNGASFANEELPWLTKMKEENKYIRSMAFGADQTAAVVWTQPLEQDSEGNDGVQLDMTMKLTIVKPDHTEISVDTRNAEMVDSVYISDTGKILVTAFDSTLYEAKEDGSLEEFLTVDDGRPELLRFYGSLMLMDGIGYDVPLIYDTEEKAYFEDEVLEDFVKENFGSRDSYAGRSYDLFLLAGDDDAVYLAGQKGVYRHVLGGSVMEQIVDGSLSTMGNPAYSIMDMLAVDNNEFLVLFTQGKVMRLVYDPDIPARPDEKLRVWSLEEKPTIRQAINVYQKANPAVYVEYEIGLEKGQPMTREDVIKNLNTTIMAGDGPDVLILDDMPFDSYIEKGILADISPLLDGLSADEAVFSNVEDAFRKDGKIYTIPCEIRLPYLLGRSSDMEEMTDLSHIADMMEDMRESHPGYGLLQLPSKKGMMRMFSMTSAPVWKTESGTIDKEAIEDFLVQSKRMYDAEMDGISEETVQYWENEQEMYQVYDSVNGEALEDSDALRDHNDAIYFMGNMRQFAAGSIEDVDKYNYHTSIFVSEGFEDCEMIPMTGQCSNVFWACTLIGINSTSEHLDMAQDFLKTVFGGEVQKGVQDGISVNRKAILDNYEDQWRLYKDNDYVSGSGSLYSDDGEEVELLIRVPDEAKVNELIQWIESMDTVYVEDTIFEGVVYEEGIAYMEGVKSLDEAMSSIETRLGIYLAE